MIKLAVVLMCIVLLSGCGKEEEVDLTQSTAVLYSISFDREEATKLVEEIEAPINDLKKEKTLTKTAYEELRKQLVALYPSQYVEDILEKYISHTTEDIIQVNQDVEYLTISQDDIEIVQVFIERKEHDIMEDSGPPPIPKDGKKEPLSKKKERLIIEESYVGQDEALKNFKRVYKFRKTRDNTWELDSIEECE